MKTPYYKCHIIAEPLFGVRMEGVIKECALFNYSARLEHKHTLIIGSNQRYDALLLQKDELIFRLKDLKVVLLRCRISTVTSDEKV